MFGPMMATQLNWRWLPRRIFTVCWRFYIHCEFLVMLSDPSNYDWWIDDTSLLYRSWSMLRLSILSKEEWSSILTLASRWRFLLMRRAAIFTLECLSTLTSLNKIYLGRDLSIPSWVVNRFVGLVEATLITDEEVLQINSDSSAETTAFKLFRIWELRFTTVTLSTTETQICLLQHI